MPVTAVLEPYRVIGRPRDYMRSSGLHHVITTGAAVVLIGGGSADLPDIPIAIGMTFSPLPAQGVQWSLIIAIIVDASILTTHD